MIITGAYGVRYFHISRVHDIETFIYVFLYYLFLEYLQYLREAVSKNNLFL